MKLMEKKCVTCGSFIYVYENYVREEMYCTLHCMEHAALGIVSRSSEQERSCAKF